MGEGDDFDMGSDQDGNDQDHLQMQMEADDSDEYEPAIQKNKPQQKLSGQKRQDMSEDGMQKTEKVENQPFDEAVEINDSEELDSEDDDEDHHF